MKINIYLLFHTVKVITTKEDVPFLKTALKYSEGLYFKILQCFDYLDQPSLVSVVETIRDFIRIQANLDVLLTDYKYVVPQKKEKRVSYKNIFPTETIFEWHNIKAFHKRLTHYKKYFLHPFLFFLEYLF